MTDASQLPRVRCPHCGSQLESEWTNDAKRDGRHTATYDCGSVVELLRGAGRYRPIETVCGTEIPCRQIFHDPSLSVVEDEGDPR